MVVAVKGHFLAIGIDHLIQRFLSWPVQCKLHAIAIGIHLSDDAAQIVCFQGFQPAVPTFVSSRVQNLCFQ